MATTPLELKVTIEGRDYRITAEEAIIQDVTPPPPPPPPPPSVEAIRITDAGDARVTDTDDIRVALI